MPFWGPDSAWVYFLDRPEDGPAGIYRVSVQGGTPSLVEPGAAEFSPNLALEAVYADGAVRLVDRKTGESWAVPSEGRMVQFSPHSDWIAWQVRSSDVANLDRRRWTLVLSSVADSAISSPLRGVGGGFIGWGASEASLIFSGRQQLGGPSGLWRSSLQGDDRQLLFPEEQIRSPVLSPGGGWVALTIAFSGDQSNDGLWIVPTDGGAARKVPEFGAYRWRSEGQLLVIPLGNATTPLRLLEVDADSGKVARLSLGENTLSGIANNTWEASPDGDWLAYLSARDGNIWVIRLPYPAGAP